MFSGSDQLTIKKQLSEVGVSLLGLLSDDEFDIDILQSLFVNDPHLLGLTQTLKFSFRN